MTTTTIRLPEELKARITAAAKSTGTTAHGFILEAIAEKATWHECRSEFESEAEERYTRIIASGKTISWQEMRLFLEARLAGKSIKIPVARKLTP